MKVQHQRPFAFQVMVKPIGSICNLNCTYCYYLEKQKLYAETTNFRISDELLETYIRQYIDANEVPNVTFTWQGGEPTLMGLDFFKHIIVLQKKYAGNKTISNSLQTNGTLLTDEWCVFLNENNFLVGISIDGPREIHDMHRPQKSGQPSWDKVMNGVFLLKKHKVEFNTLSVVHNDNVLYAKEIYQFLKAIGSGFIQFIPIIERKAKNVANGELELVSHDFTGEASVTEWSVKPIDYANFITTIFDEWVRNDVGRVFVQLFDVTLASWVGADPGLCVFAEKCGTAAVMEHNGDLFTCDHFVYPQHKLGNIKESLLKTMMQSDKQKAFGDYKLTSLPKYCLKCEYRFACHGECPKHRFLTTPDGERGLNYLCAAYKKIFAHMHPYMQFMADELDAKRPPANVMQWARKINL